MAFIWLVGLKQGCMQNFSFLGDVLVFFHYYSGRPAGRRLEKAKIRLSLSPARLSLGLAELGNKYAHVLGTKGSQKAPTQSGKLFRESNCIDGSHIFQFLAHFKNFPFFRTPCTIFWCILGQNVIKHHYKIGLSSFRIQNFKKIGCIV